RLHATLTTVKDIWTNPRKRRATPAGPPTEDQTNRLHDFILAEAIQSANIENINKRKKMSRW
ncbi:MAG: hypothetical protein ACX93J_16055, partial [Flagellimonas marinaquae]